MKSRTSKTELSILAVLATVCLVGCPSITSGPTQNRGQLRIDGQKFTPGGGLKITYANIPNRPGTTDAGSPLPSIAADGMFTYLETFSCTSHDASAESVLVFVNVCDLATGNCAQKNVKAGGIWVNSGDPTCN